MKRRLRKAGAAILCAMFAVLVGQQHPTHAQEYLIEEQCALSIPLEEIRQYAEGIVLEHAGDLSEHWLWTTLELDPGAGAGNHDDFVHIRSHFESPATGLFNADITVSLQFLTQQPSPNPYTCFRQVTNPATNVTVSEAIPMNFPNVVVDLSCSSGGSEWECREIWREMGGTDDAAAGREIGRCDVQATVQNEFDRLMTETITTVGSAAYTFRDLVSDAGGIKINDEYVHFLIPSVEGCEDVRNVSLDRDCLLAGLLRVNFFDDNVDVPRKVREVLAEFEALNSDWDETNDIELFGARVICNHNLDCTAVGDFDGDGFCDGIDYCTNTFTGGNFDHDHDGRGDGMGEDCVESDWRGSGALRACRSECDNCPDTRNPPDTADGRQSDFDADGIGDACDRDLDNDLIANNWDCRDRDPARSADWDRDGVCDDHDNCIYVDEATDPFCHDVRACAEDPDTTCPAEVWEDCAAQYGNPDQSDWDRDGTGDQCDLGITHLELVPELSGITVEEFPRVGATRTCITAGDIYRIEFRAQGGGLAADGSGLAPEVRTGVGIAACGCVSDYGFWNADLEDSCWEECPRFGHYDPDVAAPPLDWNPISSTSLGPTSYPIYPGFRADRVEAAQAALDRQVSFNRDPTANFHSLRWYWKHARRFEEPRDPIDYNADADGGRRRATRVRAFWPNYDGVAREDELSEAYALEEVIASCAEMLPGPYDVIDIAPIVAGLGMSWDAVHDFTAPVRAAALAREEAQDEFVLYGLGGAGLEMAHMMNVRFSTTPSLSAPLHLAMAIMKKKASQEGAAPLSGLRRGMASMPLQRATAKVFVYQEASPGNAQQPARLFIGELGRSTVTLRDSTKLYNLSAPQLQDVHMQVAADSRRLLLLGSDGIGEAARWQLWLLDLDHGTWKGAARLGILDGRSGFSLAFDPEMAKLVVFGGTEGGKETDSVVLIDSETLAADQVHALGAEPELARTQAGSFFDPAARTLFICGGLRSGQEINDCWRFDLVTRQWSWSGRSRLAANELVEPLVLFDPLHQRLWVAPRVGFDSHSGLIASVREPDGRWHRRRQPLATVEPAWPVRDAYLPGSAHVYVKRADASTGPGQLLLAQLKTKTPELNLTVYDHFGRPIVTGERLPNQSATTAFFCPRGQTCQIAVEPAAEHEPRAWSPFLVNAVAADAITVQELDLKRSLRDLAVGEEHLFVTDVRGVTILNLSDLSMIGTWQGPKAKGADRVAVCKSHICVSRRKTTSLSIVDVGRPHNPKLMATLKTEAPITDMSADGPFVYMALGKAGIRVLDLSNPLHPSLLTTIETPDEARRLSVSDRYLAVASEKHVHLYERPHAGRTATCVASLPVKRTPAFLRLYAGHLWLQVSANSPVYVWAVHRPNEVTLLGTYPLDPAILAYHWHGDRAYTTAGTHLKVWAAKAKEQD